MEENPDIISSNTKKNKITDRDSEYQVLARKYRPHSFSGLVGQKVLVQILSNALDSKRIAHAFILSGIRGTGKTTTARIIARALNCIGLDGKSGPTKDPCGTCVHCEAISNDRHIDILEVDAASRTGVDDVRELIDSVRYLPTSGRYKVYIIDEVHMLSKNAFNALLKTLEEPPAHAKFVFATTEIKRVPITVLSRCQRFDLSRVKAEDLVAHFLEISVREGVKISKSALNLIAFVADGSVRDGLSMLDQAICQNSNQISEKFVREMLGLADRSQTLILLELILRGDIKAVLETFDAQYNNGASPIAVFEDILELINFLTRIKITPEIINDPSIAEIEKSRGKDLAEKVSMPALARCWQMLLKGLSEMNTAPSIKQAADMVLVRLAYSSNLPTPEEAIKLLEGFKAEENVAEQKPIGPLDQKSGFAENIKPEPQTLDKVHNKANVETNEEVGNLGNNSDTEELPLVKAVLDTFPGSTIEKSTNSKAGDKKV